MFQIPVRFGVLGGCGLDKTLECKELGYELGECYWEEMNLESAAGRK